MHYSVTKYLNMVVFVSFTAIGLKGYGQGDEEVAFRHVKGVKGIEMQVGVSDLGVAGGVYYSMYFSHKWYGKIGGVYEFKNDPRFSSSALTADVIGARTLVFKKSLFVSALGGGVWLLMRPLKAL